ncbi:MAG: polyribonucleotide nucleotidyltransferase [Candidatus Nealsonbacteria bacterium]|nr:polyribonucleotide nucleotidyltransferase [Candidatus Nealsonbacteria bacterium]
MNEYRTTIGGRDLVIKPNELAEQANGSVMVQYGEVVILSTATMSGEDIADLGFFPLTVDYEERFYAAGKIRGSRFSKREGRPSDIAITTSRLIDRTSRPLFPRGLKRSVQLVTTCLSWDGQNDPDTIGIIGASLATAISDIPWEGPVGAVRIGRINNEFIINPTYEEKEKSDLNIVFSGIKKEDGEVIVNMIEGGLNEIDEETSLQAFITAKKYIGDLCDFQNKIAQEIGKKKLEIIPPIIDMEFRKEITEFISPKIENALNETDREEQSKKVKKVLAEMVNYVHEKWPEKEGAEKEAKETFEEVLSETITNNILVYEKRLDGRKLDELRELSADISILPRTHGTGLFSRGQTRSLSILTLGAPGDHQLLEGMEVTGEKRFFHHYNFPPYSVGEVKPLRGPGRREIGHGLLAEKAMLPIIPNFETFPYTIRIVSEILSSNGSTSMASVCSSSLSLMDAGVPIKSHVAGISIGIIENEKGEYKLLTDIQGKEDHHGGMDLKMAGTKKGLTAIQMDVKIKGISDKIFKESLEAAKKTRLEILKRMEQVIPTPRENLSKYAPRVISFKINPEKIREVIGSGGKVINEIINTTGATIDIEDSGDVFVTSDNKESADRAVQWIKDIAREVEVGEIFKGTVKRILDFGAFVEVLPGQEGLVHISKLANQRVEKVKDIVSLGQTINVKVIGIDDQGRINLSLKDAPQEIKND